MFYFGCDYYPEHWAQWLAEGEARWETDARMMAAAGFNTVRLAEFAWGLLEPEPDVFDFDWLDRAIDVLYSHGLHIVLGTPTPTPPPWLLAAHPDITQVTETGWRYGPGTRREACANHPVYQERSQIIVERMAAHYAHNPAVIGWQTDNEFGCHDTTRCYCDHCLRGFHRWLEGKYGDLAQINKAWGAAFWGETYRTWAQLPLPTRSAAERNPSHVLDFYRFSSDSWRDYHNSQIALLRGLCPQHFVNHNLMGFFPQLNYYDLCEELDFVTWDNYHHHGATPATIAAAHAHMWGILRRNFWVMEQQVSQVNWSAYNPVPGPDFVRLKSYQGMAHGADGMIYFRWRQSLGGSEQYHSGLLDHAGRETMGYVEAQSIGEELERLRPLLADTEPAAQVAILLDFDSRWALEHQPHNSQLRYSHPDDDSLDNPALVVDGGTPDRPVHMTGRAFLGWPFMAPYIALWERHITAHIIAPDADLSGYGLVIAPFLNVVRPGVAQNLHSYVAGGGTLILGPRSGFKDENNMLFPTPQPGPLAALTGSSVRLFDSLEPDRINGVAWSEGERQDAVGLWAEVLDADGAQILARYTGDWYAGEAAITRQRHAGGGQTVYVGTMGGPALFASLFDNLLPDLGIGPVLDAPAGVEVAVRSGKGRRLIFVLNHTESAQPITLDGPYTDILTQQPLTGEIQISPGQVFVLI